MDPTRTLIELRRLREQADEPATRRPGPEHTAWKAKTDALMKAALGADSSTLQAFRELSYSVGFWTGSPGEDARDAQYFASQTGEAAALIDAAIYELELRPAESKDAPTSTPARGGAASIFVVHGRNDARKYELVRLLDRAVAAEAVVLHEQANQGATLLEKFEHHAHRAAFAVVLLTSDDEGRLRGDENAPLVPRGRQNVIFEAGVFMGLLGRSRVALLVDEGLERPSDLDGLVYVQLDGGGAWRHSLLKEIRAAGIDVDHSRIP